MHGCWLQSPYCLYSHCLTSIKTLIKQRQIPSIILKENWLLCCCFISQLFTNNTFFHMDCGRKPEYPEKTHADSCFLIHSCESMGTYQFYLFPQSLPGCWGSSGRVLVQWGPGGSSPSPGNSQTSGCWDAGPHPVCTGLLVHHHTSAQRLQTHKHRHVWAVLLCICVCVYVCVYTCTQLILALTLVSSWRLSS